MPPATKQSSTFMLKHSGFLTLCEELTSTTTIYIWRTCRLQLKVCPWLVQRPFVRGAGAPTMSDVHHIPSLQTEEALSKAKVP